MLGTGCLAWKLHGRLLLTEVQICHDDRYSMSPATLGPGMSMLAHLLSGDTSLAGIHARNSVCLSRCITARFRILGAFGFEVGWCTV